MLQVRKLFLLKLMAFLVFCHGLLIILSSLAAHLVIRRHLWDSRLQINLGIIIGVTIVYLSTLLSRKKYTAWVAAVMVYGFVLGSNLTSVFVNWNELPPAIAFVRLFIIPFAILSLLLLYRREFSVKSDMRSFSLALRYVFILLSIALVYGVIGFELLEQRDFHRELTIWQSVLYTLDQFGIFTGRALVAYTERGKIFLGSLSLVSGLSLGYALIAFFQPVRARFASQDSLRQEATAILVRHGGSSEDYFKLWPHDKYYMLTPHHDAVIAFHVTRGVALVVGDPGGTKNGVAAVLDQFVELCRTNDWLPAFIHTGDQHISLYEKLGFTAQKIGEEAVVSLEKFMKESQKEKYFRQINNRFNREGFTTEILKPPHNKALLQRLRVVSDEWLELPGRSERGFMMGYFSEQYMQQCVVMVLKDEAGTIQAFINQVPSFDSVEANYDLLRYAKQAPGNSNDFLLQAFIVEMYQLGFERLNMGLCPLAGVGKDNTKTKPLDSLLSFVYNNGNRVYSFSGLHRFKSKYQPEWRSRYIVYKNGIPGLTRTVRALSRAMKR